MWGELAPPMAPQERLCRGTAERMRAVVSRVAWARVLADGEPTGEIGPGLLVLVGVTHDDGDDDVRWLAGKVAGLRVFDDGDGKMNRSLAEVGGAALVVSQFTLYGDARKGRRPSYLAAAPPEVAAPMVEAVAGALAAEGVPVARGRFGAAMRVESAGDGPVTILLDSARSF
jgi:D-tyrosyl-tRNA(Tyr) deacylase